VAALAPGEELLEQLEREAQADLRWSARTRRASAGRRSAGRGPGMVFFCKEHDS
jgi:hypothetical protein